MITPWCPEICRYRRICPEFRQEMMAPCFKSGEAKGVRDCLTYPGFGRRLFVHFGVKSEGMTDVEVRDAVRAARREAKAS